MDLANKLVLLRKEKGWTQAMAAKNISIQQSYLSKLENGHYYPSEDVLKKLSLAYGVTFTTSANKSSFITTIKPKIAMLTCIAAFILLVVSYFSVIFPQVFYTYQADVVSAQSVDERAISHYHLTDQYLGDKYVEKLPSVTYEYILISEREVSRWENRWLMALGLIFGAAGATIYLREYFKKRHNDH
ncbi:helix-turn-helix domain-containing protein [Flocculibacter collagenilyticus]|uniref:helix-turn-helix domain-containing protein n=1 Tax=Flocculibacter collagenilyticus TaxID=2744479 RepID=UPI0018F72B38|nr:helix-turn-helix transcriptional regulator [Flocculibacter collagenilyticus]